MVHGTESREARHHGLEYFEVKFLLPSRWCACVRVGGITRNEVWELVTLKLASLGMERIRKRVDGDMRALLGNSSVVIRDAKSLGMHRKC